MPHSFNNHGNKNKKSWKLFEDGQLTDEHRSAMNGAANPEGGADSPDGSPGSSGFTIIRFLKNIYGFPMKILLFSRAV
ncbi:MAG: hypothetical protein ABFD45_00815 [Smithella sp.]|jgi:hypothetical protein